MQEISAYAGYEPNIHNYHSIFRIIIDAFADRSSFGFKDAQGMREAMKYHSSSIAKTPYG